METDINKDFIFAHFARKTSSLQRELIAQWLKDTANEERYYEWLEEWETKHPQYIAPTDAAYEWYAAFLDENPNLERSSVEAPLITRQRNWYFRPWLMAATVVFMLGTFAFLMRNYLLYQTHTTDFGETRSLRLSDGSVVLLNANSSLRVPRWGFGKNTRNVWLTGEANFSVTHLPDKQRFVVKTDKNFEVVVLGTEFTVFARKRGVRVALTKGQIRLHYQEGNKAHQLLMKPGELALLDAKNHIALKTKANPAELRPIWGEKRFVFDQTPLREVALMLEESYGIHLQINDPALANRELEGSLRAENPDQLLQSISVLLDVNVIRKENSVQLISR